MNEGVNEIESLKTNHEEADTKIAYLTQHALDNAEKLDHVCVRSSSGDIDIPIILVGAFGKCKTQILIDNGTGKNRKTIRIDSSKLTEKQQMTFIAFHAMSGNDYVSGFMRKSKKTWALVAKDKDLTDLFCQLGVGELTEEAYEKLRCLSAGCMDTKRLKKVNEWRAIMFWAKLRKNGKVPDLSSLPPCSSSLKKHTSRAHYVSKIWKQAIFPLQHIDSFVNNGWLADGSIDWIDVAFPEELESIFAEKTVDASTEDDDMYKDVNELEDDDNLEEEEEEVDEENEDEQ